MSATQSSLVYMFAGTTKEDHRLYAEKAILFAKQLELRALNFHQRANEVFHDPSILNRMAFNVYGTVLSKPENDDDHKGYAAFRIWLLTNDGRVLLNRTNGQTQEQGSNAYLMCAAGYGCREAQLALQNQMVGFVPSQGVNSLRDRMGL